MSATKAMTANLTLTTKTTEAILEALKAGMTKDEVSAVLARITEMLDGSDD